MGEVAVIPVVVKEEAMETDALPILGIVRPSWISSNTEIKSKVFTDGLSNKLVGFYIDADPEDVVVVKVFGVNTDLMIDHKAEVKTMTLLHQRKCGSELYATFENGICYEYINGKTLDMESCLCPSVFPLVAKEMAKLHSSFQEEIKPPGWCGEIKSQMWSKMRRFNDLAEDILATSPELKSKYEKLGIKAGWAKGAIDELEGIVESHGIPVSFCHNDLLLGNIIYNEKLEKITFIDFEYCMPNYPAFDVANHFLEFAGIVDIDYSNCPDQAFQSKWIAEYLSHLKLEDKKICQSDFEKWVKLCTPASHLMWGLWGIVQARHSTIDFDYIGYTVLRLSEYKKLIISLRGLRNGG